MLLEFWDFDKDLIHQKYRNYGGIGKKIERNWRGSHGAIFIAPGF
jgi:hypothetical protein